MHKLQNRRQRRSNYSTPFSLRLNPRLSNKDIIGRDVPLGGTHWSSAPDPNMTSWIQMAEAGEQAARQSGYREDGGVEVGVGEREGGVLGVQKY